MRKQLARGISLLLLLSTLAGGGLAETKIPPMLQPAKTSYTALEGVILDEDAPMLLAAKRTARLTQRMATRSGPGTKYSGLGSYFKKGQKVTVISKAYDKANGIWWVQVEFTYGGKLRRAYTGAKRVKVNLSKVSQEKVRATATTKVVIEPWYGPGKKYTQHTRKIPANTTGKIIMYENGYALFEYNDGTLRRAWVLKSLLNIK